VGKIRVIRATLNLPQTRPQLVVQGGRVRIHEIHRPSDQLPQVHVHGSVIHEDRMRKCVDVDTPVSDVESVLRQVVAYIKCLTREEGAEAGYLGEGLVEVSQISICGFGKLFFFSIFLSFPFAFEQEGERGRSEYAQVSCYLLGQH
jgi:hypothetical protein